MFCNIQFAGRTGRPGKLDVVYLTPAKHPWFMANKQDMQKQHYKTVLHTLYSN